MLHAHLPFVYHPEEENLLEERWLFEAISETYIPLIQMFEHLVRDEVPFKITMSMTPPLISMLKSSLLQERYIQYLNRSIELAEKELDRTGNEPHFHGISLMYYRRLLEAKELFCDRYKQDIVNAFKAFQEIGCLEIVTCCATHGFLPIIGVNEQVSKAQIHLAVDHYIENFECKPKGIWLAECGYVHGVDEILKDAGLNYFFVDAHGILHAEPRPRYDVYAPLFCPSGVAAFGRDEESSRQVWSSKEGYPGDPDYREYYKDIGYELDFDYIKPYIHPEGIRVNTGLKYWRITGKSEYKEAYRPDWAQKKAAEHAADFLHKRIQQVEYLSGHMDRTPIITAPYDAELFGHWWFEGPMWLDFLIRKTAYDQDTITLATPSEYLKENPTNQVSVPAISSWGHKGFNEFWLNEKNDWVYRHLQMAGVRMTELANKYSSYLDKGSEDKVVKRALNQAARELLLAESSDWPFIMSADTMVPYACKRIKQHIGRFTHIYDDLSRGEIDEQWLNEVERRDEIFPDIDCAKYYINSGVK